MALDFSKIKELIKPITEFKFGKLESRSRILVILGGMIGIVLLMYFVSNYFFGGQGAGSASVAAPPSAMKTLPGADLSAQYERVTKAVEEKRVREAELTGGSAIGSISNVKDSGGQCNIICSDQSVNVKSTIDDWQRRGELSDEVAADLLQLANKQVSPDEYAARLNELVKQGKLTPEQARELLAQYKKQYANARLQESGKIMDGLITSGDLSLDLANQLLSMQKDGATPSQYAAFLNKAVRDNKLSAATAQQLLAQYSKQHTKQIIEQSVAFVHKLARDGKLVKEVEDELVKLEYQFGPLEDYQAAVQKYVDAGKLIPATAKELIDEYKMQKASVGSSDSTQALLQKAEAAAFTELDELEQSKKLTKEVADQLRDLIRKDVPMKDFEAVINRLVQEKKMTPEISKLKLADYRAVRGLRDLSRNLNAAQANNLSRDAYSDILKDAVQAGIITPDEAARLMNEYLASLNVPGASTAPAGAATPEFARLQEGLAESSAATNVQVSSDQFVSANTEAKQVSDQDREAMIQGLMGTMSNQAQQLITGWQPPVMQVKAGMSDTQGRSGGKGGATVSFNSRGPSNGGTAAEAAIKPVLVKAGAILFAVLDTEVNSDYPDSPVMATIVQGPYKGAKLLGKLSVAKSVAGQMDKVALSFTVMNTETWPKSKSVTAFAIDPDNARTVLASEVDYHYMQRFGAIMATSFVQGYASAIQSSGGQIATTGLTTTSTSPALSPRDKLAVGIGKIGQTLGDVTQNYVNIPPTVKINAGVGIGILFMADLT